MGKPRSGRDEATERSLGARARRIDQYATSIEIAPSARAGQGVNPLFQRARRIPALHGDFRHQCMRNAMQQDVGSAGILGRLASKALLPMAITSEELPIALLRGLLLQPARNGFFVKMNEDSLTELLDSRQPVGVAGNRRTTNS